MNQSFNQHDISFINTYQSRTVIGRAANSNSPPKTFMLKRLLKISLIVGPILAWLLWLS